MTPSEFSRSSPQLPTFRLPNLFSKCPFTVVCHPNCDIIGEESDKWYENGCSNFTNKQRRDLMGLKAGVLAAAVYHDTDDEHLRVICDFMNYIFHLDDLSDGLLTKDTEILADIVTNALEHPHSYCRTTASGRELPDQEPDVSKLTRDFWARCLPDSGPGFQTRMCQDLALYMTAVSVQAQDRDNDVVPSLRFYIHSRRDNSGVRPLMDGLEYTLRIDLPADVIDHTIVKILRDCVNDFVSWSNDIFSFNVEQARGDTFNLVAVLMKHHNLDIQGAVDKAADMCCEALDVFQESKSKLPSWCSAVDKDVARYVIGLESWMSGSLHWSFISQRYFGPEVHEVKQSRVVRLLPSKGPTHHTPCKLDGLIFLISRTLMTVSEHSSLMKESPWQSLFTCYGQREFELIGTS